MKGCDRQLFQFFLEHPVCEATIPYVNFILTLRVKNRTQDLHRVLAWTLF
jgi:hypothetical protein